MGAHEMKYFSSFIKIKFESLPGTTSQPTSSVKHSHSGSSLLDYSFFCGAEKTRNHKLW
jgi:hypothetical protein